MVSRKSEVEVGCRKHEDARLNAAVGDEGQLTIPLTPTLPLPLTVTLAPNLAPTLALTLTLTLDPHPKQVHDANRTWRVAQPNHAAGVAFGGGGGGGGGGGRHGGGGGGSGGGYGGGGGFGGGGGAGRLVTPSPRPASSTRRPILFK